MAYFGVKIVVMGVDSSLQAEWAFDCK